jgi:Flp pilus assembly protein TadD
VWLNYRLAQVLFDRPALNGDESIRFYTTARALRPEVGGALAWALWKVGRIDEAISVFVELTHLRPGNWRYHNALGCALSDTGQLEAGMGEFKRAMEIEPKEPWPHTNLGWVFVRLEDYEHALVEFKKALEIDPKASRIHAHLGYFFLHHWGGDKKQLEAAITELKRAIELDPKDSGGHYYLGVALRNKNQIDDAISELEKAIALDPKSSDPHAILGQIYQGKHKLDLAMAEFSEGIRLDPNDEYNHFFLASALGDAGNLQESLEEYRKAEQLALKRGRVADLPPEICAVQVHGAERLVEIQNRFPAILEGKEKPANDAERLELAAFCRRPFMQLYAASFRFHAEAFANDPKLAADVNRYNRESAACSAALAGCGKGRDAGKLTDMERARMRKQALEWLRADLTDWTQQATSGKATDLQRLEYLLKNRQETADLACVRDKDSLEKLPAEERDAWQKLWDDVEQSRKAEAERKVRLEAELPDVLAGTATPADNKERVGLATLCVLQGRFAAATRLYGDVFAADAEFADDLENWQRYNAASYGAFAAAGKGEDAGKLDDQARARLRRQALDWLRADLTLWTKQADSDKPDARTKVAAFMQAWQRNDLLASVRDKDALDKLSAEERDAWRNLWDEVAALRARTQEKK